MRLPIALEIARADPLEPPQRRDPPFRRREVFDEDRVVAVVAVHGDRRREADGRDTREPARSAARSARASRAVWTLVRHERRAGSTTRSVSTSSGRVKPGIHLPHRLERADHQAGRDEQHDRERDLDDDQRVAGAVAGPPGTRQPAAFLQRAGQLRPRELQDRDQTRRAARRRARSRR